MCQEVILYELLPYLIIIYRYESIIMLLKNDIHQTHIICNRICAARAKKVTLKYTFHIIYVRHYVYIDSKKWKRKFRIEHLYTRTYILILFTI